MYNYYWIEDYNYICQEIREMSFDNFLVNLINLVTMPKQTKINGLDCKAMFVNVQVTNDAPLTVSCMTPVKIGLHTRCTVHIIPVKEKLIIYYNKFKNKELNFPKDMLESFIGKISGKTSQDS